LDLDGDGAYRTSISRTDQARFVSTDPQIAQLILCEVSYWLR
jgi:hypothetical protein